MGTKTKYRLKRPTGGNSVDPQGDLNKLPSILAVAFGDIVVGVQDYTKRTGKLDEYYVILETDNIDRLDAIEELAREGKLYFAGSRSGKIRVKRFKRQPNRLYLNLADLMDIPSSRSLSDRSR